MTESMTGGCRCGAVRYDFQAEPMFPDSEFWETRLDSLARYLETAHQQDHSKIGDDNDGSK